MSKLIAKLDISDPYGNQKVLQVFTDEEQGTVSYRLKSENTGIGFSISNLQCGWRGPALPDNTYEYEDNISILEAVIKAVRGGVYRVTDKKLFVK